MEAFLRNIEPGSVVQLPPLIEKAAGGAKLGVFMGAEYSPNPTKTLYPYVQAWTPEGKFEMNALPECKDDEKWSVVEEPRVLDSLRGQPIHVPYLDVQLGTDPEIFCVEHDGQTVIPAWRYLLDEGTADEWYSGIDSEDPKRFWDGVQAEWCPPPSREPGIVIEGIHNGLRQIRIAARRFVPDAELSLRSTAVLTAGQIASADPQNLAFRCTPSINVYDDPGNELPEASKLLERYAGGHLHGGNNRKFTAPVILQIVRALDGILGIAGVSLAAGIDDPRRRRYYGRAGEFRLPKHGIEYRVLSNFWLCHPAITDLVFRFFHQAMALGSSGLYKVCWKADQEKIRNTINNCDVEAAREMLRENQGILLHMAQKIWDAKTAVFAVETLVRGVGWAIENPFDFVKNWHLEDNKWNRNGKQPGGSWESLVSHQLYPAHSVKGLGGM